MAYPALSAALALPFATSPARARGSAALQRAAPPIPSRWRAAGDRESWSAVASCRGPAAAPRIPGSPATGATRGHMGPELRASTCTGRRAYMATGRRDSGLTGRRDTLHRMPYSDPTVKRQRDRQRIAAKRAALADGASSEGSGGAAALIALAVVIVVVVVVAAVVLMPRPKPPQPAPPTAAQPPE